MCVKDENGILIVEDAKEALRYYMSKGENGKNLNDARLFQPFDAISGLVQHLSFYDQEFFNLGDNSEYMDMTREKPLFSLALTNESAPQDVHWHNYSWEIYVFTHMTGDVKFSWQHHSIDMKGDLTKGNWSTYNIANPEQLLVVRPGYCHFLDLSRAITLMVSLQVPPSRINQYPVIATKNPVKVIGDVCPQYQCDFREKCIALQKSARAKRPFAPTFA